MTLMTPMKSITIFGGAGFIGRALVKELAKTGCTIRVAGRNEEQAASLKPSGDVGQIIPVICDVRDEKQVLRALYRSDTVINLTGVLYQSGHNTFEAVHYAGAANIARMAAKADVETLVHVSAIGASVTAASKYARSKAKGEAAVLKYFPRATIVRPSLVFGPADKFFNKFAPLARWAGILPLIGGGKTKFQPVYVGDVARALATIAKTPQHQGKVYELGGPKVYTFKQLMVLLVDEIYRPAFLVPLPFWWAFIMGFFLEILPFKPLITRDQVRLLKTNNVVHRGKKIKTFKRLGIVPTAVEVVLPQYLMRFRPGGPWAKKEVKTG